MGPEFITEVNARMALETPQVVLTWDFESNVSSPMDTGDPSGEGVYWPWDTLYIRRSPIRFPESQTEGDEVLTESFSLSPSVSIADLDVGELENYYYSLFLKYTEPNSCTVEEEQDIKRLSSSITSVYPEDGHNFVYPLSYSLMSKTNGSTISGNPALSSSGANFLTNEIQAGNILRIHEGGADDGYYEITSVDSETQVSITPSPTLTASNVDFDIYSHHQKFWISGTDYHRKQSLWRWNSNTMMVDKKLDLSNILDYNEHVKSISYVGPLGGTDFYICFLTNKRYIRIGYYPFDIHLNTITDDDIVEQWNLSSVLPTGFDIVGSCMDPSLATGDNTLFILDSISKTITKVKEDGTFISIAVIFLPDVEESTLKGLSISYVSGGWKLLLGNKNCVYQFLISEVLFITSTVENIRYLRQNIVADFGSYINYLSPSYHKLCIADYNIETLQVYTGQSDFGYLWQQPFVPDKNTVALYHLNETSPSNPQDSGPNGYNGTNNGMVLGESGRFYFGAKAATVAQYIDISTIGAGIDVNEGSVSFWFSANSVAMWSSGSYLLFKVTTDANNYIEVSTSSGNLVFKYCAGGVLKSISVSNPSPDLNFHCYFMSWSKGADEVKAYVDGTQVGTTQTGLGVWAGAVSSSSIGGGGVSALGVYDEVFISKIARIAPSRVQSYTSPNKMWAMSGRDYENPEYA